MTSKKIFRTVACGLSGGVDSAVAAYLLKRRGFRVLGIFMRNWDAADENSNCSIHRDEEDAAYVCRKLSIPFMKVDFIKEYWNDVFVPMVDDYSNGKTPNPDILCNRRIKFNAFFHYATHELGADAIATGHYARTSFKSYLEDFRPDADVQLLKSVDESKDQTFFLSTVHERSLRYTMFPVGSLLKAEVKTIAVQIGLERIKQKKESMGICFIGSRKFDRFINEYVEPRKGKFVNLENGETVGEHTGVQCWTIGQRSRVGGQSCAYYVVAKDHKTNVVYVAPDKDHSSLYASCFLTASPHWITYPLTLLQSSYQCSKRHLMSASVKDSESNFISQNNLKMDRSHQTRNFRCQFRFQHIFPLLDCLVYPTLDKSGLFVKLATPLRALTPGQFAVFYSKEICLGAAEIDSVGPSTFALTV